MASFGQNFELRDLDLGQILKMTFKRHQVYNDYDYGNDRVTIRLDERYMMVSKEILQQE